MAAIRELYLTSLLVLFSQISGQRSGNATIEQCGPSNLNIVFNFSLGGENFYDRSWYLNSTANKIAAANSTGFLTVEPPYSSRVTLSGTNGITLSHVSSSDSGSYLFIIITDTSFTFLTATTTVIINDTPDNYCIPVTVNNINSITCKIPAACPAKNSIQARWNDNSTAVLTCPSTTAKYNCCAVGDPVTKCYNGSLCTEAECKADTTITMTTASTTILTTKAHVGTTANVISTSSGTTANITTTSSGTTENITTSSCTPPVIVIIGVSFSGFLFILVIIIIICCCWLYCCKKERYSSEECRNGTELKQNYNETNTNYTAEEDATSNSAYGLSNTLSVSRTSDEFPAKMHDLDKKKNSESESNKLTQNAPFQLNTHASEEKKSHKYLNQDWKDKLVSDKHELEESKKGKEEITNL